MIKSIGIVIILMCSNWAQAFDNKLFLKSSFYGASIGAAVGLGVLALSDEPGKNLNYVTRGASLGLYAGLAIGAYLAVQEKNPDSSSQVLIFPAFDNRQSGLVASFRF